MTDLNPQTCLSLQSFHQCCGAVVVCIKTTLREYAYYPSVHRSSTRMILGFSQCTVLVHRYLPSLDYLRRLRLQVSSFIFNSVLKFTWRWHSSRSPRQNSPGSATLLLALVSYIFSSSNENLRYGASKLYAGPVRSCTKNHKLCTVCMFPALYHLFITESSYKYLFRMK